MQSVVALGLLINEDVQLCVHRGFLDVLLRRLDSAERCRMGLEDGVSSNQVEFPMNNWDVVGNRDSYGNVHLFFLMRNYHGNNHGNITSWTYRKIEINPDIQIMFRQSKDLSRNNNNLRLSYKIWTPMPNWFECVGHLHSKITIYSEIG